MNLTIYFVRRRGLEPEWKESTKWTDSTEDHGRGEAPMRHRRVFAAAVLAESDAGRWALAVLRGEPTAARALVELAIMHLRTATRLDVTNRSAE